MVMKRVLGAVVSAFTHAAAAAAASERIAKFQAKSPVRSAGHDS